LKINFILPFYSSRPIGGLKVAYEYANHLAFRGHAVTVIHPRFMRNIDRYRDPLRSIQTVAINARNVLAPRSGLRWQKLNKDVRMLHVSEPTAQNVPDADFVFATAWQTAEYVVDYPKAKGQQLYIVMDFEPWIASAETLEDTWRLPLRKITISKWLYSQVSQIERDDSKLVNIPIGIDLAVYREMVGIRQRPNRVAMFYSSAPSKNSTCGLAAIEKCKSLHPDLEATFFGSNSRRRPRGIPNWIVYRGNVSQAELVQIYNSARVFVSSSLAEGFGLPGAEAMACGCAVASTDCGGNREYASHDVNALLSPAGDAEALADNIARLLSNEALRVEIAERGRRMIQDFTWERSTNHLEEFLNAS
jgi:glycosyltransferase involved in cell wall biosynthesis